MGVIYIQYSGFIWFQEPNVENLVLKEKLKRKHSLARMRDGSKLVFQI